MTKQHDHAPQGAPPVPVAPIISAARAAFEEALAKRFTGRIYKRYEMPRQIRQAAAVYILEISSREEVQASILADQLMDPMEKRSIKLASDAEQREMIRASVIGIERRSPADTFEGTNTNGVPWMEYGDWPKKATDAVQAYYRELNSVPIEEVLSGMMGARTYGAASPPTTSATQAGPVTAT